LLHGAYASVHAWEPWVDELGDEFRLISFDLPGFGLTGAVPGGDYSRANMSRTLDQIMRLMKLERAIIVGHSMGGSVALQYALDHPQKIRGLILIGSSGMRRTPDEEVPSTFGLADISWLQPILRYVTPRFMIERGLRDSVADPDSFVTDEQVTRYWELIRMTGSREAMLQRRSLGTSTPPLEGRLAEITLPTLLIWGAQDKLVPLAHGVRMNRAIFNSRLLAYPDLGHLPMEEAPAKTAAEGRAFVNGLTAN
jgi:pimeloyl-ACP methyl ester carboxylesterase